MEIERKMLIAHLDALFQHAHQLLADPTLDDLVLYYFDNIHILRAILTDPDHSSQAFVEDGTLKETEDFARDVVSVISEFDLKKMDTQMVYDLFGKFIDIFNDSLLDRLSRISLLNWPKQSRGYYSMTGIHGYIDHLVEYLEQVKARADDFNGPLTLYILRLQPMLQALSGHLVEIPERRKENADLKFVMEGITECANDIEYVVDAYLVRDIALWYSVLWLQHLQKELHTKIGQLNADSSGDKKFIINEIQDLSPAEFKVIPMLINIDINEKLDEISNAVENQFALCTRSLVSSYKRRKKEVFLQLLSNAYALSSKETREDIDNLKYTSDMSEDELIKLVRVLLEKNRHFVILEDVDDIRRLLWDDIEVSDDDVNFEDTVLLTTHSQELVAYCHNGFHKDLIVTKMSEDHTSTSRHTNPTMEGDVVGFKAETEMMLERLTGEPKHLNIISIAGMAGQGKTTLARKLYNDFSVINYFDIRAWACVSQVYSKKELLLELLSQVLQLSDTFRQKNDEELAAMLWKSLTGQRFLVVLDDLWSTEAWDDLKRCFPNQNNGSRIIFTTRQESLASKAQSHSTLQHLNPLSDDESWALLQKKLFQNESCPRDLSEAARKIAKQCKGLPLSVVLTAGVLGKMEKRKDVWEEIVQNLSSRIFNDARAEDKGVIELSYKHLPDPLKPCFLYFGAFLEDREVPVQKLIRLWIAEGFIKHSNSRRLEDVAEDYLLELIERSLVIVAQEKSDGGVKSCRVHDLLREFSLTKATEENFFQQIHGYDEQFEFNSEPITLFRRCLCIFSMSNCFFNFRAEPKSACSSEPITYNQRRLCIYSENNHFFKSVADPLGPNVRSLLFFSASDISPSYVDDISFIFRNFKLLRILKCEDLNIGSSFNEIGVLLHLRYLAVQGTMVSVPSSISNLWNLETFCVKPLEDKVMEVPDSIWNITRLRHLHIDGDASFELDPNRLENSFILDNLQTLSTPSLAYGDDMEKMLRKLRGIRKLKCNFLDSWDDVTKCNHFPVLEFLNKLESLKVFYNGERLYPCLFKFPTNLKKLTLIDFRMPWSEISQLATLEHLEVLKLLDNAFEGETWEMEDDVVFPKLKFLKLDALNVVEWIASGDNFPVLERLILHKCEQLEEIPPGIGDIPTLLMVEVKWCSRSAAISTREIQEMQSEVGNEEFKINVHPKIWDSESSS